MTGFNKVARLSMMCGVLIGCGGVEGGIDTGGPNATADLQRLPFVTAAGELKTFDPQNPTGTAVDVDAGVTIASGAQAVRIWAGSYRISDNSLADPHHPALVYLKQGQVFRLDLMLKSSTPVPTRVSAVDDACRILAAFFDFANIDDTRIAVETAGIDNDCSTAADNVGSYFRLGAGALTAGTPIPAGLQIVDSVYGDDGSLRYVLGRLGPVDNRELRRYSASLGTSQRITALAPGTSVDFSGPEPSGSLFYFHLQPAGGLACLYGYDAPGNSLGPCLHSYPNESLFRQSAADGEYVYYAFGNLAFRRSHTGNSVTPLRSAGPDVAISDLRLSAGRVILNSYDSGSGLFSLESVPRSGGTIVPLKSGSVNPLDLVSVAGPFVYAVDLTDRVATAAREDGSERLDFPDSGWGGFSKTTDRISLGARNAYQEAYHGVIGQTTNNIDVTVVSFNAQSGAALAELGSIPYATASRTLAFGRYRLTEVAVYRPETFATDTDVYFADTLTDGSLQPLATTPGQNDFAP